MNEGEYIIILLLFHSIDKCNNQYNYNRRFEQAGLVSVRSPVTEIWYCIYHTCHIHTATGHRVVRDGRNMSV